MSDIWGSLVQPRDDTSIDIALDDQGRIERVTVRTLADTARRCDAFNDEFQHALRRARSAGLSPATGVIDADGRARASRVTVPPRRPLRELMQEALAHRDAYRRPDSTRGKGTGPVSGTSTNDCVTVVLDPSGPGGELDIDQGWLSQVSRQGLSSALEQAFSAAYARANDQRDR